MKNTESGNSSVRESSDSESSSSSSSDISSETSGEEDSPDLPANSDKPWCKKRKEDNEKKYPL